MVVLDDEEDDLGIFEDKASIIASCDYTLLCGSGKGEEQRSGNGTSLAAYFIL